MEFFVDPENNDNLPNPCFTLNSQRWDDFGNKTRFKLYYIDKNGINEYVGQVKIMHREERITLDIIPRTFEKLSDEYCSLGQEMQYYETLNELLPKEFNSILDNLNDAAFFPAVRDDFEAHQSFVNSLLRSSESEKILDQAKKIVSGTPTDRAFNFTYSCQVPGAEDKHIVNFNFADNGRLPNRIIGLVGKNGTGKTQFMAKMAVDLGGQSGRKNARESFTPHRPLFSKIIAISYSAFDKFKRPDRDKSISYKYCGLRDENGLIGPKRLVENYKEAVLKIEELNRGRDWYNILSVIIGKDVVDFYYDEIFDNKNYEVVNQNGTQLLSSGQSFLMYVITEVIANIRKDSLLLFDEPEMHLHPNAIANLIRMIHHILERYDSYAILATHSPIILQEIPSRYVYLFDRQGSIPIVRMLGIESLGESIEVLTQEVFQTKDVSGTYKEVLKDLSQSMSYKSVLKLFEDKLSLNAKTYLLGLYDINNNE